MHLAGGDADAFADEDEEGRMFGGGLNEDQKVILDMCVSICSSCSSRLVDRRRRSSFEQAGDDTGEEALTLPALRRQLIQFERAVKRNQEMRVKFPDEPEKSVRRFDLLDAASLH